MKKVFFGATLWKPVFLWGASLVGGMLFASEFQVDQQRLLMDGKCVAEIPSIPVQSGKSVVLLRRGGWKADCLIGAPTKLPARNLLSVRAYDAKNGRELQLDKEYNWLPEGALYPPKGASPRKIRVEYTYDAERYDALFRTADGKLRYVTGPIRKIDSEEHIPELSNAERLAVIAVRGSKMEIVRTGIPASVLQGREYFTDFLSRWIPGKSMRILSYGDSITAVQNGKVELAPGGPFRDRLEHYFARFDSATREKAPKYDRPGIKGIFTRAGWNWGLIDALKKNYAIDVEYCNGSIGGTHSGNTPRNGSHPDRLAACGAVQPDLVLIAFGMNELRSMKSKENVVKIARYFQKQGAAIVIVGVPRTQAGPYEKTNEQLAAAAKECGAAFVDLGKVNPGVAPHHYCSGNRFNHPGLTEFSVYRAAMAGLAAKP